MRKLPMTSDQFRLAITKLELSQLAAARLLGVNNTTLRQVADIRTARPHVCLPPKSGLRSSQLACQLKGQLRRTNVFDLDR
jgi:DNA-binding transcriptional regulator YdaS (Cro superfamily)